MPPKPLNLRPFSVFQVTKTKKALKQAVWESMVAKNTRPEEGVLRKKEAHFDILGLFWTGKGVFEAKLALPIGFFSVF